MTDERQFEGPKGDGLNVTAVNVLQSSLDWARRERSVLVRKLASHEESVARIRAEQVEVDEAIVSLEAGLADLALYRATTVGVSDGE